MRRRLFLLLPLLLALTAPSPAAEPPSRAGPPVPSLPPVGTAVFRMPTLVPRPDDWRPAAPAGFRVTLFAGGVDSPRRLLVLPNGDVLVAQSRTERMAGLPDAVVEALTRQKIFGPSPDRVLLLREGPEGVGRQVLLEDLSQPFGLLWRDGWLYVANTDSLLRFRFEPGAMRVAGLGEKVLDLPAGPVNNHWTRNLAAAPDGRHLYVTVGAASNVNEDGRDPPERAAIWEVDPEARSWRPFATGLRNPVGLAFAPASGELWTTVNERDGLGEDVPPDYMTRVVEGAFYGWPYVYFGSYADPTWSRRDPARVAAARGARVPDLALGGHSVPLGLLFPGGEAWPARWRNGALVARRGGGGRVRYLGYDVVFVPFRGGDPLGTVEPFLTGFVADYDQARVYGRPVDLAQLPDGSLLVSDDAGDAIWRVAPGPR